MSKPEMHDFAARYGGRIVALEVYVNSDEDAHKLAKRVQRAARGMSLNAVICLAKIYEGPDALEVWNKIAEVAGRAAANPESKSFTYDEE